MFPPDFSHAVVTRIISQWQCLNAQSSTSSERLGRTMLQKLVYFTKVTGVPISFNYELHYHGPFSKDLADSVSWLEAEGAIVNQGESGEYDYGVGDEGGEAVRPHEEMLRRYQGVIHSIVSRFRGKKATDMELLATVDFVRRSGGSDVARVVREIQVLKGCKFSEDQIRKAINDLSAMGF